MLDPGTRIGDWIIDSPLDEGGMGAVYRCHNFLSERITAAVKVMDRQRADVSRDRFVREVEALASLRHEAIVRILGFGEAPEHRAFFIAMEMVEGDPLAKRIQQGAWAWPGPREVFLKLARGLAHAHGRGIAHRDIKPQNLMYGADGSACIIDFGISAAEGRTSLTTEGMFLGTVTHMAPELFGHQAPDPIKADIYALGQVFYEVLTGHRAFTAQSALTAEQRMVYVMASKMNCEVLDPGPESPDALRALIRESTQPDPSRRTPDLTAFVAALEAVPNVPGPGLPTPPPLPPTPAPRNTSGGGQKIVPPTALMATPHPPLPVASAAPAPPDASAPSLVPPPPVVPGPVTGSGKRADIGIPTRSGRKPGLPPVPEKVQAPPQAPAPQPVQLPAPPPDEPAAPPPRPRGAMWGLGVGLLIGLPVGLALLGYQLGWFDAPPPTPEPPTVTSGVNPITGTSTGSAPATALKSPSGTAAPSTPAPSTTSGAATSTGQTARSSTPSAGSTGREATSGSKTTTDRPKRSTTTPAEATTTAGDPNARMFLEIGLSGDVYSPPLMAMIQGRSSAFEACFQGAGAVGVSTTVIVRWTLDAGQVTSAPRASGGSGALNACLERRVKDIPFDPTQSGGAELELVYKPAS